MIIRMKIAASIFAVTFAGAAFAQTPAKPERIRGDIVSFAGDTLKVHRNSGDTVSIEVDSAVHVNALKKLQLSDIKAGSYVGAGAMPSPDGKLVAKEVLVFPEAGRGTGEGHYAWGGMGANSTMTNANVDTVVEGTNGRDLKLSYKGGSNTITVPPSAPIVTFVPATSADLVAGKKVFVLAAPAQNGTYSAKTIVVEKNGVVPPM
jgi:hypothetical protein